MNIKFEELQENAVSGSNSGHRYIVGKVANSTVKIMQLTTSNGIYLDLHPLF